MRRDLLERERELRWRRVKEKRVGEERMKVRRRRLVWTSEKMEWERSERCGGERVERAAMITVEGFNSSIMGSRERIALQFRGEMCEPF